ncbi:MAG: hypothetical protein WC614_05975 [bacterium]
MDKCDIGALLQRVDRLERENLTAVRQVKLMKLAGLAVVLGIAVILFCGAKTSNNKVIEAQEFRVVDRNGKSHAILGILRDGNPELVFWDENGQNRAALYITDGVPGLTLRDENGKQRASLCLTGGDPRLMFYNENGVLSVHLSGMKEDPGLMLSDENGKASVILTGMNGNPGLSLFDGNGKSAAMLSIMKGKPGLSLFDKNGNPLPVR